MRVLLRRRPVGLFLLLALAFVASSCRFDGAYDLPLPGGRAVKSGDAITVTAEFTDALKGLTGSFAGVMTDAAAKGRTPTAGGIASGGASSGSASSGPASSAPPAVTPPTP